MYQIEAYKVNNNPANLEPLSVKREWMDQTYDAHAYKCFPVSLTNQLGWGISFPEDISFIWDGVSDSSKDHVKIIKGEKYAYTDRSNATISFKTGLMFKTNENTTLLQMPVPNNFMDGISPFTALMSTSFYYGEIPCAWRITKPNVEITIKANTPVIAILPIDLSKIQNSEIIFKDIKEMPPAPYSSNYISKIKEITSLNKWANFYRDAVNDLGKPIGKHQVKSIKLKVINS